MAAVKTLSVMSLCAAETPQTYPVAHLARVEKVIMINQNYIHHLAKSLLMCEQFSSKSSLLRGER